MVKTLREPYETYNEIGEFGPFDIWYGVLLLVFHSFFNYEFRLKEIFYKRSDLSKKIWKKNRQKQKNTFSIFFFSKQYKACFT